MFPATLFIIAKYWKQCWYLQQKDALINVINSYNGIINSNINEQTKKYVT